ncbi:unnamed protein product [Hyaloperonospora brassicae]|uniref:Uncharacterized protein n=1 Tax=Hyaloperonospora brassicae TaxID=162125 RepID=A0AAV0TRY6_HYABA|nr:unnamed protein product [Hyaloperonospora brassicae]
MTRSDEQWTTAVHQPRALYTENKSPHVFCHDAHERCEPNPSADLTPSGRLKRSALCPLARFDFGAGPPALSAAQQNVAAVESGPALTLKHCTGDRRPDHVIDLTLNDEDSGDDETRARPPLAVAAASAVAMASDSPLGKCAGNSANSCAAAATMQALPHGDAASEPKMPLAEEIESDVDEEWPQVPAAAASSLLSNESLSMDPQATYSRTRAKVGATLDAICKAVPLVRGGPSDDTVERSDETDSRRQREVTRHLCNDKGDVAIDADVGRDLSHDVREENEKDVPVVTASDPIAVYENLEDGEIFEERGSPVPVVPIKVGKPPSITSGTPPRDAVETRLYPQQNKQKKRGKKKPKRKLEAMQMMHTPPCGTGADFKRTIRQRAYVDALPPNQRRLALARNSLRGEAMNVRPVYQEPPPAFCHAGDPRAGILHSPAGPPLQRRLAPPPVLQYGDSQILRINRQGSVEMLEGGAGSSLHRTFSEPLMQGEPALFVHSTFPDPPMHGRAGPSYSPAFSEPSMRSRAALFPHPTFPEPVMQGGFQYRPVPMPASLPMSNRPGVPLKRFAGASSQPPHMPTPHSNVAASKQRDESEEFNLDSLRVAALRSKTKYVPKTTERMNQKGATAAQSISPSLRSPAIVVQSAKGGEKPAGPGIDKLRLEILQSMKRKRPSTTNDVTPKNVLLASEPVAMETSDETALSGNVKVDLSGSQTDQVMKDELSEPALPDVTTDADHNEGGRPISKTDNPATGEEQKQVDGSTNLVIAVSSEEVKPQTQHTIQPLEFRPLTASSQSLVIRLSPEDFSPHDRGSDTDIKASASSSLQGAIYEMRRKIAEREKEKMDRLLLSAATWLSKQSLEALPSSALPSTSSPQLSREKQASTEVAQLANGTTLSTCASAPAIETAKDAPMEVMVDGEASVSGQPEASIMRKMVLTPCEGAALSAKTMETAADQDSHLKEALTPQALSDTLGVSIVTCTHVSPSVLQYEVLASSDVQNADPAGSVRV